MTVMFKQTAAFLDLDISNLSPSETVKAVFAKVDVPQDTLIIDAKFMLYHAAMLLKAVLDVEKNKSFVLFDIANLDRAVSDGEFRTWLIDALRKGHPELDTGGNLDQTFFYWLDIFPCASNDRVFSLKSLLHGLLTNRFDFLK